MTTGSVREKFKKIFIEYKNRFLSIALILLTLVVATYIYRTQSKYTNQLNVKKDAESKKNELFNQLSQSEKKLQYYKGFFNKKEASSVINTITKIAKDSNIKILSIKPNKEDKRLEYIKYPFVLSFSVDSYHAIGKFISKLENYPDLYFLEVLSIELQETSQKLGEGAEERVKVSNKLTVDLTFSIIAFEG